jgi:hypothetical protein
MSPASAPYARLLAGRKVLISGTTLFVDGGYHIMG